MARQEDQLILKAISKNIKEMNRKFNQIEKYFQDIQQEISNLEAHSQTLFDELKEIENKYYSIIA